MDIGEKMNAKDDAGAILIKNAAVEETMQIKGKYVAVCFDKDGNFKWRAETDNVVVTVGKNAMLDNALAGSAYTVTGPYLGLISSVSYTTGPVAGDTMSSHGGWTEAGIINAPTYSGNRKTAAWNAASGGTKALSVALAFTFTGGGTVKGAFMTYGSGAVNTIDSTAGTLFSAAAFTGGDKVVANTDVVNVSYQVSL